MMLAAGTVAPVAAASAQPAARSETAPAAVEQKLVVQPPQVESDTAVVRWVQFEPSSSTVEYGESPLLGLTADPVEVAEAGLATSLLSALAPATQYYYRISTVDQNGQPVQSEVQTFTTLTVIAPPAPPAIRRQVVVPVSIDATGATDAAPALQRFINDQPDGTEIQFPDGGVYRLDTGLKLTGRRDLSFVGYGVTLRATGSPARPASSVFALWDANRRIRISGFHLEGDNPNVGTELAFTGSMEYQMGVLIWSSFDVEVIDTSMTGFWGDCVYIGTDSDHVWSERVRYSDSECYLIGRNGVSVTAGRDVSVERVRFDGLAGSVMDIEPFNRFVGASRVELRDNQVGTFALGKQYTCWLLAAAGWPNTDVRHVYVIGNTISGNPSAGSDHDPRALHVRVERRGPRVDFVIRDNVATLPVTGPSILIVGVDGLTISGNIQPLIEGPLAVITDSTDVQVDYQ